MKNRIFVLSLVAMMTIALLGYSPFASISSAAGVAKAVDSLAIFQGGKFNTHYRAPNIEQVETLLDQQGIPLRNPNLRTMAVQRFQEKRAERNPTTPNPEKPACATSSRSMPIRACRAMRRPS